MSLQFIKSIDGKVEYVLLPIHAYEALKPQLNKLLKGDYVRFVVEDYVSNPVALARIEANLTQQELAKLLGVSQAYVSQIERKKTITKKQLERTKSAIAKCK